MFKLCSFVLAIGIAGGLAHASAVDRKPLFKVSYQMFPGLLKNFSRSDETAEQIKDDKGLQDILQRMCEYVEKPMPSVMYVRDSQQFVMSPGQAPRLMRTPSLTEIEEGHENIIYINEEILEDPNRKIDFIFLLKFIFHEISHKIGVEDLGLRDKLAQLFENHLNKAYSKTEKVSDELELLIFSLSNSQVVGELAKVSRDQIQPTNVFMIKRNNTYFDLTPAFLEAMKAPVFSMRALWAEVNNAINTASHQVAVKLIAQKYVMSFFTNPKMSEEERQREVAKDPEVKEMLSTIFYELRFVEVHSVEQLEMKDSQFLSLKATFVITRTGRERSHVVLDGVDMPDLPENHPLKMPSSYLVPMTIQIDLPKAKRADLSLVKPHIQLRPNAEYGSVAKVGGIIRSNGQISRVKIKFPSNERPKTVSLPVQYGDGFLTLYPVQIEKTGENIFTAEFEIDPELYQGNRTLVAESILINLKKTLFLDHLLNLNSSPDSTFHKPTSQATNAIVPGTVGIWGVKDGKTVLSTEFDSALPIFLDHGHGGKKEFFIANPSMVPLEFQLEHPQQIREIRLQYKRTTVEFDLEPGPGKDGYRTVKSIIKNESHEILAINGKDLQTRALPQGRQNYGTIFQLPLTLMNRPQEEVAKYLKESIGKKQFIFIVSPVMFEAVTDDLQTFRHYFVMKKTQEQSECEKLLEFIEEFKTNAI